MPLQDLRADAPLAASEATPLLAAVTGGASALTDGTGQGGNETCDNNNDNAKAAAKEVEESTTVQAQILWLCVARLVEPIAFFSIFPYVNEFIRRNGNLPVVEVGFYSGLIESLFSLTQAAVMVFWARMSDRVGRKPVLVASMMGVTAATSLFGFARSIPQMIMLRMLAGIFSGTVVTIRTSLAELSTPETQARIFSWFAFSGNFGIFLGPLVGGSLADPASQYGGLFSELSFFKEFPYALPSLAVGVLSGLATLMCALRLHETNRVARNELGDSTVADSNTEKSMPIRKLLGKPGVSIVLLNCANLGFLAFSYTAICPLWWFTPIELGGFGFDPFQISVMLAISGISQALWLIIIFPPLHRRRGTNGIIRLCGIAYPLFFCISPIANYLLRTGHQTAFWVVYPPALALGGGVAMSFTASQLAVNEVSPSASALSIINALQLMFSSIVRAVAPALATSLFAVGAKTQFLNGYAIWLLMACLAGAHAIATRFLPDYEYLRLRRLGPETEPHLVQGR